jgi:glutamate racemase
MKNNYDPRPIGIFDSGVGGLTTARCIYKLLPAENIIYVGDTAHIPYGSKSPERVYSLSKYIVNFLLTKNVKMVVVACNTASSVALDKLQEDFPQLPIIGVILPAVKLALQTTRNKRIGVIGTEGTIKSNTYKKFLLSFDKGVSVFQRPCPLLVPIVEEGLINHKITYEILKYYLTSLVNKNIDTLILGCTHYPLLKKAIQKVVSRRITLIDSAKAVSLEVKEYLNSHHSENKKSSQGKHLYYVTDAPEKFKQLARLFLGKGEKIGKVEKICLDDYILTPIGKVKDKY